MKGKILFYNEEKGFGKIIDNEKNEYFFHINKIKIKPSQINKNDEVEFEFFDTDKGLNAKDIRFIIKITCPVCSETNEETNKTCKNEKCKWDLSYAKDGAFIGLSQSDIEEYNNKLSKAKVEYLQKTPKALTAEMLNQDMFETTEEYEARINNTVGIIGKVVLQTYNADTEYFEAELIINNDLINHYLEFELFNKIILKFKIERAKAKELYASQSLKKIDLFTKLAKINAPWEISVSKLYIEFHSLNFEINIPEILKNDVTSYENGWFRFDDVDIVFDSKNNLMWQDDDKAKTTKMSWNDTCEYAKNLKLGGYNDWRLPTREELKSIIDKNQMPTINKAFQECASNYYWSSSTYARGSNDAWVVGFSNGYDSNTDKRNDYLVRCVRDSKNFDF